MSGTVTSPGYPGYYASNLDCTYSIQTISGATISLNFQELDVESSSNCGKDQLYVSYIQMNHMQLQSHYVYIRFTIS